MNIFKVDGLTRALTRYRWNAYVHDQLFLEFPKRSYCSCPRLFFLSFAIELGNFLLALFGPPRGASAPCCVSLFWNTIRHHHTRSRHNQDTSCPLLCFMCLCELMFLCVYMIALLVCLFMWLVVLSYSVSLCCFDAVVYELCCSAVLCFICLLCLFPMAVLLLFVGYHYYMTGFVLQVS